MKNTLRMIAALLLSALCLAAFTACGGSGKPEVNPDATLASVTEAVLAAVPDADKLTDAQDSYLGGFFDGAKAEDFAGYKIVVQSVSTSIDEIGIFEAKTPEDVAKIEAMVDAFFALRNDIWDDRYLKEEFPKLQNAKRVTMGNFVMYVILGDDARAAAVTAFEGATTK